MKFYTLILLTLLISSCSRQEEPKLRVVNGVADLRECKIDEKFIIPLSGKWEFYWKKLLRPADFNREKVQVPDLYGKVPAYWSDYDIGGSAPEDKGYATYRAIILLPHQFRGAVGLSVPVFDSSFDLYVNGSFAGGNGTPGTTRESTIPGYDPFVYRIMPRSDTIELVINVANFHHRRGGFWLPVTFGDFSIVMQKAEYASARSIAVSAILLAFSVFFMMFFLISMRNTKMLWFSIALFGFALRSVFTSPFLIHYIADPSWLWIIRLEYLALFVSIGTGSIFLFTLLTTRHTKQITFSILIFTAASSLLTLFTQVVVFSNLMLVWYPFILLVVISSLGLTIWQLFRHGGIHFVNLIALGLLIVGGIHDSMLSASAVSVSGYYILPFMMIFFVFLHSGLIIQEWINDYMEKERLGRELQFVNENLERIVETRTKELKGQKLEVERRGKKISEQNSELKDIIEVKNRIFSVIAHDLRSPLVSLLYLLNLLRDEKDKSRVKEMIQSGIRYSQTLIGLLENMLIWGRDQENRLIFSPVKTSIPEIVLNNFSLIKEEAERKNIKLSLAHKGKGIAWCDRDLIDIVLRNIITNAIKYTPNGGSIEVTVSNSSKNDNYLEVSVRDTGVGMDKQRIEQLFVESPLESQPGTDGEKGTGLGLKLAHQLTKINKGVISVISEPGKGATFTITLPKE